MAFENKVQLPGSDRKAPTAYRKMGKVAADSLVSATVILRRAGGQSIISPGPVPKLIARADFPASRGADPNDIKLVESFAHQAQLTVAEASVEKRRVVLKGTAANMANVFDVKWQMYKDADGNTFRARTGVISVPADIQGAVVAVLGLDERPQAKPHFRRKKKKPKAPTTTFTAPQVATLYNFPTGMNGTGQTVGIVELGGGYNASDLQTYFTGLGLGVPSVTAVSVDGGVNTPGGAADGEVELDIEVVGSIANGANIAVYFAPNTDQGFVDAITDAVHDTARKVSIISISWGGPEESWTQQALTALNAALQDAASLGVTVTIASGDGGSSDGAGDGKLHVDFPSSSPYALACGGTKLTGSGTQISSEVVWNETAANEGATGGGVSNFFAVPSYQAGAGVPAQPETGFVGRGVPDVAGNADPATGYVINVDGQSVVVGGTSAVAPLWAGLIALINQQLGTPVGFLNPKLYPLGETVCNDITSGSNDDSGLGYYSASAGWDPCTGLGSPNGAALLSALSSSSSSAKAGK